MNLSNVKEITIGNKEVKQLKDTNGNIWWKKSIIEPYTFVSYIESSGTQYIDTNFIPNQDTKVEISISTKTISGSANRSIFGSRAGANSNHYGVTIGGNNCWWNGYGTTNGNTAVSVLSDTFYEIEKNKNVTTINGTQMTPATAQTFTCPSNLYLFGMNQNGITARSSIRLYSCKIYDNGTLVRNFKPCVRNNDGVIGLLDEVNDVFYTNAGTGTFEEGKEIVNLCDNSHYLKAYIFESQNKISYDENSRLKYAHVPKNTDLYVVKSTTTNRYRIALMDTVPAGEAPIGSVVFNADNKNVLSTIINSGNYEYVAIQYSNSAQDTDIEVYEI